MVYLRYCDGSSFSGLAAALVAAPPGANSAHFALVSAAFYCNFAVFLPCFELSLVVSVLKGAPVYHRGNFILRGESIDFVLKTDDFLTTTHGFVTNNDRFFTKNL